MKINKRWIRSTLLILIMTIALFVGCSSEDKGIPVEDDGVIIAKEDVDEVDEVDVSEEPEDIIDINGEMEVHFIDVGQGDSILIKQDGNNMLIDAGESWAGEIVVQYLEEQGVEDLKYVIGTHPHADHIGGLSDVINNFPVESIIMPEVAHTTKTFERLITTIQDNGLKITKPVVGDEYRLGDSRFTIVGPNNDSYSNLNDYSVMLRLVYRDNSFMLTGDAEIAAEEDALTSGEELKSDVLKLGHHGSDTSTTDRFLDAVDPNFAIIQVGADNKYGHPSPKTLSKLENRVWDIFRNDINGTIVAITNGENIRFEVTSSKDEKISVEDDITKKEVKEPINVESNNESSEFIGNKNSKILHKNDCGSLPNENNRVYFDNVDEGLSSGYRACKVCNP